MALNLDLMNNNVYQLIDDNCYHNYNVRLTSHIVSVFLEHKKSAYRLKLDPCLCVRDVAVKCSGL